MAKRFITEKDVEIISQILSRGNEVTIKRDRNIIKICEKITKVAKKKQIFDTE